MNTPNDSSPTEEPWLAVVRSKVASIRFGSVQITVHEGKVTQVESIEKTRIAPDAGSTAERRSGH